MAHRSKYWSCSEFADWLRGTAKPEAETSKGWADWNLKAKQAHPIRYWLAEEALDKLQQFIFLIPDKLYDIKYYFNNRFISRTHSLTAHPSHIRPGSWRDLGDRILPCLFNELVNFVEVELAWKNIAWDHDARKKYNPPFHAWGWWRFRTWRCTQAGLDHLAWEMSLVNDGSWGTEEDDPDYGKPTFQAQKAKEILELYRWWTEVYPNRPDPHDASGWTAICDRRRESGKHFLDFESNNAEEEQETRAALDLCHKIEEDYHAEDEQMLIRLIKIRRSLWT
ncbi:MAG: hypothetical protein RLZZ196_2338 [Bacteroidota bacterium]|jgi:hypothetical protein